MSTDFRKIDDALKSLTEALMRPPANDLERDGVVQRFEYCFELTWKIAKRVLQSLGITATSPKGVIRELASQQMISDPALWMRFLLARNYTSHTYDEATAKWVFSFSKPFLDEAKSLVQKLKQESNS